MIADVLSVGAVAVLCVGWVLFQRWIARMDADLPGIQRSCSGCPVPGAEGDCGSGCGTTTPSA